MPDDEQLQDAAIIAFPNSGERRLRIAIRNLDAALEEQRQAVAAFQAELAHLGQAVQGLGASAQGLQDRLHEAAEDTALAHDAALRLQQTAAAMDRVGCDA
jgi:Sec-independent protein translocase protein TatA